MLALVMLLGLCACGNNTDSNTNAPITDNNTNETITDSSEQVTQPSTQNTNETTDDVSFNSIDEISFVIKDTEFRLGIKMSDLLDSGIFADIEGDEPTLDAHEAGGGKADLDGDGSSDILFYLWNLTDEEIAIEDATVIGLRYNTSKKSAEILSMIGAVSYAGKQLNSSIDSVRDILGKPNVHEQTYEGEEENSAGWRGFDIGEEFRLNLRVIQDLNDALLTFDLQFKPY
jgi:hypothetical protein